MYLLTKRTAIRVKSHQPFDPPSVYDWIENSLVKRNVVPFVTLGDIIERRPGPGMHSSDRWAFITPRTALFVQFFSAIRPSSGPVEIIEALHAAGGSAEVLESLPEAVLIPLREAIVDCQSRPPVTWKSQLLSLVDREDVKMLLFPELQRKISPSSIVVSQVTKSSMKY
jgi:anaphase-promoting complex subunit 1